MILHIISEEALRDHFNAKARPKLGHHDNGQVNLADAAVRSGNMDMIRAVLGVKPKDVPAVPEDRPQASAPPEVQSPPMAAPPARDIPILKPPTIRRRGRGIGGQGINGQGGN